MSSEVRIKTTRTYPTHDLRDNRNVRPQGFQIDFICFEAIKVYIAFREDAT